MLIVQISMNWKYNDAKQDFTRMIFTPIPWERDDLGHDFFEKLLLMTRIGRGFNCHIDFQIKRIKGGEEEEIRLKMSTIEKPFAANSRREFVLKRGIPSPEFS